MEKRPFSGRMPARAAPSEPTARSFRRSEESARRISSSTWKGLSRASPCRQSARISVGAVPRSSTRKSFRGSTASANEGSAAARCLQRTARKRRTMCSRGAVWMRSPLISSSGRDWRTVTCRSAAAFRRTSLLQEWTNSEKLPAVLPISLRKRLRRGTKGTSASCTSASRGWIVAPSGVEFRSRRGESGAGPDC